MPLAAHVTGHISATVLTLALRCGTRSLAYQRALNGKTKGLVKPIAKPEFMAVSNSAIVIRHPGSHSIRMLKFGPTSMSC